MRTALSLLGTLVAASPLAFASVQAQPVSLTIASGMTSEHSSTKAMEIFKVEVARRSHNSIAIELAPNEQLGSAGELVQKLRADSIFALWAGAAFFARLVPEMEVVNLPFVFSNYNDALRTINGPVGKFIESKVDAKGFVLLAWLELGVRNVAVDDFKNLKIFTSPAETYQATFRALGAIPMPISTKEVYTALRQGDIDGVDSPYNIMVGYKYYDNMKYVSDSNHVLDLLILVANKKAFSRLTPEQQKTIKDVASLTAIQQRKMTDDAEAAAFASLKAAASSSIPCRLRHEWQCARRRLASSTA